LVKDRLKKLHLAMNVAHVLLLATALLAKTDWSIHDVVHQG
jgi:hypothetical protein